LSKPAGLETDQWAHEEKLPGAVL